MLNAIRFVVFGGGEFKFEALIACRSVHVAPHVVPSVSSADVTVNVINGVAVGVGVGVTFGLSLVLNTGAITATSLIFRGNRGLKVAASSIAEAENNAATNTTWSAKACGEVFFFICYPD
jgi:hypothetical protein